MNLAVPVIPESAPFTPEQRAWLNGYLAGLMARGTVDPAATAAAAPAATLKPLILLFGSQTGTAETLARRAAKEAGKRGFAATVTDMAGCSAAQLAGEKNLLVITSTYGDGEPPDNARALHAALDAAGAPLLAGVRFSVCALGDTNYTHFCRCGIEFDLRLEKLGATRTTPRVDCDLDYEERFTKWLDAALSSLAGTSTSAAAAPFDSRDSKIENSPAFGRANPFPATVLAVRNLNGAGSAKEVNHVEFSLADSGLAYEPGDALGVMPQNCPALVGDVLAALGCDGEEAVPTPAGEQSLRTALTQHFDLGRPSPELQALLGTESASPAHVIDVLLHSKIENRKSKMPAPADFVHALKKLQPRLYSIASSPRAHPGQVHLTVGAVRYERAGRSRKGACSTFLAERAAGAGRVGVFVHSNPAFRLPADGATPVIMVGPGTGIAPFRAFLQERQASGAKGRNWLFFGDQHAATDFLYREELMARRAAGTLHRLDVAFSRDQPEKIYVQQRMLEGAAELYAWLEAGAHFYVCGDAARMAKDVDAALHQAIATAGGKGDDAAATYVQALRSARRYQRDVY